MSVKSSDSNIDLTVDDWENPFSKKSIPDCDNVFLA
jgi:hypothetical protein